MSYDVNLARKPFLRAPWLVPMLFILWMAGVGWTAYHGWTIYSTLTGHGKTKKQITQLKHKSERLTRQISQLQQAIEKENVVQMNEMASVINTYLVRHAFSWSQFLDRLEEILPYSVRVLSLNPQINDKGGVKITIQALTEERDGMLKFIDALHESPYFQDPHPSSIRDQERGVPEGRLFNLTVEYLPDGQP